MPRRKQFYNARSHYRADYLAADLIHTDCVMLTCNLDRLGALVAPIYGDHRVRSILDRVRYYLAADVFCYGEYNHLTNPITSAFIGYLFFESFRIHCDTWDDTIPSHVDLDRYLEQINERTYIHFATVITAYEKHLGPRG